MYRLVKQLLFSGSDAEARPGIMRLMDEARQASIKVAVCSAATKSSVIHVVKSLLGEERFEVICLRSWVLQTQPLFEDKSVRWRLLMCRFSCELSC